MIAVVDASVLIGLSSIGYLDLIRELFTNGIYVPEEVWKEVVEQGRDRPGAMQVARADWLKVRKVGRNDVVQLLKMNLDAGEAEAIALADEIKADFVLLDERDARKMAKQLNLRILGTIGILMQAKRSGKIKKLGDVLNMLQNDAGFRISKELYEHALKAAGE